MPDADATSTHTPPPPAPTPLPPDEERPLAFLLGLLAGAPGRQLTRGELNKKLRTKAAEAVGLSPASAPPLLERCSSAGYLRTEAARRAVSYTLSDAGAAKLDTLRALLPEAKQPSSRGKIIPPASDQVRAQRATYLLLKVLQATGESLPASAAGNHLETYAREALELNAATARHHLQELVAQGLLSASGEGRIARCGLTLAGRVALANAEFPAGREFRLSGQALNALLEAAREVGKQFAAPPGEPAEPPARAELDRAVQAIFDGLLRERHAVTGLVPIHEVRAEVRQRFGDAAARHDLFDDVVVGLWRAKKIRLTPIADHARATPEQLRDAIPGVGETLFYLEAAHAPAAV
jgi:hypothetical protein